MSLPTPEEIRDQLLNNAFLTEDQALIIAAEIYQPLKDKVDRLESAITMIAGSCEISNEIRNKVSDELSGRFDDWEE